MRIESSKISKKDSSGYLDGEMIKDRWLRVRFTSEEEQKLESWAIAYSESKSSFIRRLLQSLPASPDLIAPPLKPSDIPCENSFFSNQ